MLAYTEEKAIGAVPNEVCIEVLSVLLLAALEYSSSSSSPLVCQFCLAFNLVGHQWNCWVRFFTLLYGGHQERSAEEFILI